MSEQERLYSELERAESARQLLANKLLQGAIADLRARYIGDIEKAGGKDETWLAKERLAALNKVVRDLEQHVTTGKLARSRLDELARLFKTPGSRP